MELIRQNFEDRCVAGHKLYIKAASESDTQAYVDKACTTPVEFDELTNAFMKGNLIIVDADGCAHLALTYDVDAGNNKICRVAFADLSMDVSGSDGSQYVSLTKCTSNQTT
jgi:hypothetical protein